MEIPDLATLQEQLTLAQDRATWLLPTWQIYQNISDNSPRAIQYRRALDNAHPPGTEMLPDSATALLARSMAATAFPFACIRRVTHHFHQGRNLWQIQLTRLPGSLQAQSMIMGHYRWSHATSPSGLLGFLRLGVVLASCKDIIQFNQAPSGFFASATSDPSDEALYRIILARANASKNSSQFIISGEIIGCHQVVDTGGTFEEQKAVERCLITHRRRDRRWCIHHRHTHATALWYVDQPPPQAEHSSHPPEQSSHSEFPGSTWYMNPSRQPLHCWTNIIREHCALSTLASIVVELRGTSFYIAMHCRRTLGVMPSLETGQLKPCPHRSLF